MNKIIIISSSSLSSAFKNTSPQHPLLSFQDVSTVVACCCHSNWEVPAEHTAPFLLQQLSFDQAVGEHPVVTAVDCCRQLEELNVGELHLHLGTQPVQYCAQPLMDNLADLLLTCPSALGKLRLAAVAEAVAVAGEAAVVAEAEAASEAQVAVAGVPVAAEVVVTVVVGNTP